MLKKLSTLLLTILMVCTIFTVNTFADEGQEEPPTEVPALTLTPVEPKGFDEKAEILKDVLEDAAKEEGEAALKDIVHGELSDAKDEIIAAANELLAKDAVEVAEIVVDKKLEEIAVDAGIAQKAEKKAETAADNADKALNQVLATKDKEVVEEKLPEIFKDAMDATIASNQAHWAYIEAEKDYAVTVAQTEATLAAGLITAEEAAQRTEAVKQDLLEKKEKAEGVQELAQGAFDDAAKKVDDAKAKLDEAAKNLEDLVKGTEDKESIVLDVAVDAGKIVVSEGVLIAADAAVALTKSAIWNLENNIENCEEQLANANHELVTKLADVEEELKKLSNDKNRLDVLNISEQNRAINELNAAKAALESSQAALEKAMDFSKIADAKNSGSTAELQGSEVINAYKEYQESLNKIKNDDGTPSATDREKVVKYVLENVSDIQGKDISVVGDVVVVKDRFSQVEFFTIEIPDGKEEVVLTNQEVQGKTIFYNNRTNKYYYTERTGLFSTKTVEVTVNELTLGDKKYDLNEVFTVDNTKAQESAAQEKLTNSENRYVNSLYKTQEVIKDFDKKYEELNQLLEDNDSNVKALTETLVEYDKQLNGGFTDQLIRGILTNEEILNAAADLENADLLKVAGGVISSTVGTVTGAIFNPNVNIGEAEFANAGLLLDLLTQISKIGSGDVDASTILKDIAELAKNNSISLETQKAIAELIRTAAKGVRDNAIDDLKEHTQEFGSATVEVVKAATTVAAREAVLADRSVKLALANANLMEATDLYNKAEKADKAADDALAAYLGLMLNPNIDRTYVENAKQSWLDARDAAYRAWEDYRVAKNIYDNVYAKENHNQGESNGHISFDGMNKNARYDIIAEHLSASDIDKYSQLLKVNAYDGRTFLIDAYVAENGNKYPTSLTLHDVVWFSVLIPEEIRKADYLPGTNARVYDVSRWHDDNDDGKLDDGEFEPVVTGLTPDSEGYLSIPSQKYSIFVITARDYHVNYSGYKAVVNTYGK